MRLSLVVAFCALMISADASQQHKVSFAGKWTPHVEKNAEAMKNRLSQGQEMTIAQDEKALTVISTTLLYGNTEELKNVYALDNSESKVRKGTQTVVARAQWKGDTIVIVTVTRAGQETAIYSISGDELKVETTLVLTGDARPLAATIFYKKG